MMILQSGNPSDRTTLMKTIRSMETETKIVLEDGSQGKITPDTPSFTLYQIQAILSDQQEEIQRKKAFLRR